MTDEFKKWVDSTFIDSSATMYDIALEFYNRGIQKAQLTSENPVTYKIRRKGSDMFSCGSISSASERTGRIQVSWSKKGKEWKSERLFKAHLTKCIEYTGGIPDNWEIFELNYKATPIDEWIDANMLIKMLTHKK